MDLKYFVIILALLSVSMLYLLSTYSNPTEISFSEISRYEDKQVSITGAVSEYYLTSYNSQIITIRNLNESEQELSVYVEIETDIEYGDIIKATGKIQKYQDGWELVVSHPKNIEILTSWRNNSSPIWQLAERPEKYVGCNICTTGVIDRKYDSYYFLIDSSGRYSLVVYFNPNYYHSIK